MLKLSVVIPAYNEEYRIIPTLDKINTYLKNKKYNYEIIVVDDGSTDKTAEMVEKQGYARVLKNQGNKGKGYSVKQGMLAAKKEWILFTDADLSTPIEEIEKFRNYTDDYEVLIGSRALAESNIQIRQPFYREFPGILFGRLVRLFCLKGIKDSQCGFKLFFRKTAQEIFSKQTIDGFSFDVEILYLAQKYDYKIKQIPVTWINDVQTKVSLFKDSFRMFKDIIGIRIKDFKGKYT